MSGTFSYIVLPMVLSIGYLGLLTLCSSWAQGSSRAADWTKRPIVFGLALGVYATTWTFYGSVGFATRYGYGFAAISLGVVLACLAIPVLWAPLGQVVQEQRLANVADLFAYRFQSRAVGVAITLFLLAGMLPYVSLQLRAIGDAALALAGADAWPGIGLCYTLLLILFAASVGTHFAEPWRKQTGLLIVLAAETLCKTVALLVVGGHVLFDVFGGPGAFLHELQVRPEVLENLYAPVQRGSFPALIVCAFFAAFVLPRQFHVAFVLQPTPKALWHASWTVPLVLLLLNLPLPILFLGGERATPPQTPPDLYVLLASSSPVVRTVAFLGGVSAASAMVLVSTIALSGMVVHHLWQPFVRRTELVARTPHVRRAVVLLVVLSAFAFHSFLPRRGSLVDLGLVSFTAVLQLAPGLFGTLFWKRASRAGLLCGLAVGVGSWVATAFLPLLGFEPPDRQLARLLSLNHEAHNLGVWLSVSANAACFVIGSLLSPPAAGEAAAAASCRARDHSQATVVPPESVQGLEQRISAVLGPEAARAEVGRALADLGLSRDERGMLALLRLRERTQRNLAEALGPLPARAVVSRPSSPDDQAMLGAQLLRLEEHLAGGGGGAMDRAYGFVLGALSDLPVGLCAVDASGRVAVWNQALVAITGLSRERVLGAQADGLDPPFRELLKDETSGSREVTVRHQGRARTLRVHRSRFAAGALVMVEDLTEEKVLREQLGHHDRLASIGALAAGMAHEIGNPLSGLLMVAKNLRGDLTEPDAPRRLEAIVREGNRIEAIVRSLLAFSHKGRDPGRRTTVFLQDVVRDAAELVTLGRRGQTVRLDVELAPDLMVLAERQGLTQVVVNLLTNALDASPAESAVLVRGGFVRTSVYLDVEDFGHGVDPAIEALLFAPFATTKDPGQGTGLGLAVSLRIAQQHGGRLEYQRTADHTTRFRLTLPRSTEMGAVS